MKYKLLLLLLFITSIAFGQRKPNEFTEETNPVNANFEVYSQKDDLPRRATLLNLKKYFDQEIYLTNDTICLTRAVGDTCLPLAAFSQALSIDSDSLYLSGGGAVPLSSLSSSTDDQGLSISNDSLIIESGNSVQLTPYRQTVDSLYILGDKLYISLSNDNTSPKELNIASLIGSNVTDSTRLSQDSILLHYQDGSVVSRDTIRGLGGSGGVADGNGIVDDLPAGNTSIDADGNNLTLDQLGTLIMRGNNHVLTKGTSTVALLASNRLSSVHNGFMHQDGLGTYAHYTNGTNSAVLKLFADEAELGVSNQNGGVGGYHIFVRDDGVYTTFANSGGITTNQEILTSLAWKVRGPLSGVNDQPYITTTWADSSINILGKYDLPNTVPTYAQSVPTFNTSGDPSWSDLSAIGGSSFTEITNTKAQLIAVSGAAAYVAPASLGNAGVLTIDDWGSFASATIIIKQSEDYDNSTNDFVLQIVDSSGASNTWDASDDDPAFDLVIPTIQVWDAGPAVLGSDELASYGIAEVKFDNTPSSAISWASGTISIRFSGADLKGKSWNVITITK